MTFELQRARRGYSEAAPPERAVFGMLTGFSLSIAISRAINYVRERRRPAPRLRGVARSVYHSPGRERARVHHFLPGIGVAFATGVGAIVMRDDGREAWLSPPFGAGIGLTSDELGLLLKLDNPYWGGERASLIQAGAAAGASVALAVRFLTRERSRPKNETSHDG